MNGRWKAWILAFSLGLNAVIIVAWVVEEMGVISRGGKHGRSKRMFEISAEELNLTGKQQKKWNALQRQQDRRKLRMKADSVARLDRLKAMLMNEELNSESLHTYLEDLREGAADYAANMLEGYLEERAILTPEQDAQLKVRLKERTERMRQWMRRRLQQYREHMAEKYGETFVEEALLDLEKAFSSDEGDS